MKSAIRLPPPEHAWAAEAIPWFANGTLPRGDVARLQAHLQTCGECRRDLELEERLVRNLAAAPAVDYAPQASLAKVLRRLDEPPPFWSLRRWHQPRASTSRTERPMVSFVIGAQAAALVLLAMALTWLAWRPQPAHDSYHLAGGPAPTLPHLQVIFDENTSAADALTIVARVHGRVIAGPSSSGVFLVAIEAPGDSGLNAAARILQDDPGVQFVAVVQAPPSRQP